MLWAILILRRLLVDRYFDRYLDRYLEHDTQLVYRYCDIIKNWGFG